MIVYKDYLTFTVMGEEINLFSDEDTDYGRNTVAEINGGFHYLGDEPPGVSAAIFAWQEVYNRELSSEELHQVLVDNHLISEAI
jgi:hypothetical protein